MPLSEPFAFALTTSKGEFVSFSVVQFSDDLVIVFDDSRYDVGFFKALSSACGEEIYSKCQKFFIKKVVLKYDRIILIGIGTYGFEKTTDEAGDYYYLVEDDVPYVPLTFVIKDVKSLDINRLEFGGLIEDGIIECDLETLEKFGITPRFRLLAKDGKKEQYWL